MPEVSSRDCIDKQRPPCLLSRVNQLNKRPQLGRLLTVSGDRTSDCSQPSLSLRPCPLIMRMSHLCCLLESVSGSWFTVIHGFPCDSPRALSKTPAGGSTGIGTNKRCPYRRHKYWGYSSILMLPLHQGQDTSPAQAALDVVGLHHPLHKH